MRLRTRDGVHSETGQREEAGGQNCRSIIQAELDGDVARRDLDVGGVAVSNVAYSQRWVFRSQVGDERL